MQVDTCKAVQDSKHGAILRKHIVEFSIQGDEEKSACLLGNKNGYRVKLKDDLRSFERPAHFLESQAKDIAEGFNTLINYEKEHGNDLSISHIDHMAGNLV